ncbi:hypothetical protein BDV26DRAFT_272810 [Aspergillus bertholletiae]|uniref:Uncharacterized protein n=1 Tax=Aspergillus bertholletiae TaxID=1226010 RepID=A0A5N7ATQ6_9EURO|nr:hypothetical protein BDV26DRAFT_272810 [Aspergillus bertholletiae]
MQPKTCTQYGQVVDNRNNSIGQATLGLSLLLVLLLLLLLATACRGFSSHQPGQPGHSRDLRHSWHTLHILHLGHGILERVIADSTTAVGRRMDRKNCTDLPPAGSRRGRRKLVRHWKSTDPQAIWRFIGCWVSFKILSHKDIKVVLCRQS